MRMFLQYNNYIVTRIRMRKNSRGKHSEIGFKFSVSVNITRAIQYFQNLSHPPDETFTNTCNKTSKAKFLISISIGRINSITPKSWMFMHGIHHRVWFDFVVVVRYYGRIPSYHLNHNNPQ